MVKVFIFFGISEAGRARAFSEMGWLLRRKPAVSQQACLCLAGRMQPARRHITVQMLCRGSEAVPVDAHWIVPKGSYDICTAINKAPDIRNVSINKLKLLLTLFTNSLVSDNARNPLVVQLTPPALICHHTSPFAPCTSSLPSRPQALCFCLLSSVYSYNSSTDDPHTSKTSASMQPTLCSEPKQLLAALDASAKRWLHVANFQLCAEYKHRHPYVNRVRGWSTLGQWTNTL